MLRKNLIITIRNFTRNKTYSVINVIGLSIGLACVIIILSWVRYEMSFDDYHQHSDRIYRVQKPPFCTLAPSFVPLLKKDFPEIEQIARMTDGGEFILKHEEKSFVEKRLFFAEENIFSILSLEMLAGNMKTALSQPNCIVIAESAAQKYFGTENPLGKILMFSDTIPLTITGVIKDMPVNSHIHLDFLVSFLTLKNLDYEYFYGDHNFSDNICLTYMRLAERTDPEILEGKFPAFIDRHLDPFKDDDGRLRLSSEFNRIELEKVTDIHLHSHSYNEIEPNGDIKYVRIFSLVALFILLIAGINYVNLSIAKGLRRSKEITIKKTLGSQQGNIVFELMFDSFFYTLISLFLAVVIYETVNPCLRNLWLGWTGRNLLADPENILIILGILIFTNLVAGLYPAIYISRFQPIQVLRSSADTISRHSAKAGKGLMQKTLVVIQFAVSIAVMIGIGVINKQMKFMQNTDLGYDRENIIMFPADYVLLDKWNEFKQRLMEAPGIEQVSASKRAPTDRLLDEPGFQITVNGNLLNNPIDMPHNRVEHDFFRTYRIGIVAGRDFNIDIPTDASEAAILNETAVRQLGFETADQAVGSPIRLNNKDMTVIGVCRDFHYESLHYRIPAMVTYITSTELNTVAVRVDPGDMEGKINTIRKIWNEFQNNTPFDYSFLDERVNRQYQNEQRMLTVFNWFGVLAILIACLGLYGLTAYSTERRTKEIGIRKVNGASTGKIILMLSYNYIRWVVVAFILVCPVSYYLMRIWLQNFTYRTPLSWWIFLAAGFTALVVAWLTVTRQSYTAAVKNPVESLKYE
jgi:putative ABC transport system permease protein